MESRNGHRSENRNGHEFGGKMEDGLNYSKEQFSMKWLKDRCSVKFISYEFRDIQWKQ
jgi:hypothetical protein